jgi:hypothetical protein
MPGRMQNGQGHLTPLYFSLILPYVAHYTPRTFLWCYQCSDINSSVYVSPSHSPRPDQDSPRSCNTRSRSPPPLRRPSLSLPLSPKPFPFTPARPSPTGRRQRDRGAQHRRVEPAPGARRRGGQGPHRGLLRHVVRALPHDLAQVRRHVHALHGRPLRQDRRRRVRGAL